MVSANDRYAFVTAEETGEDSPKILQGMPLLRCEMIVIDQATVLPTDGGSLIYQGQLTFKLALIFSRFRPRGLAPWFTTVALRKGGKLPGKLL